MTADDLAALNEQIAAMARAGLPLDQGLQSIASEMSRGRLRAMTQEIADDLRSGLPLPEALARQEGRLPSYYAKLVTAGIQVGRLPQVLSTLTVYARTVSSTRSTVVESLFYPAVVLIFGFALIGFLSAVILPEFDQIFEGFGMKLPAMTEAALAFGRYPLILIVLPASLLFGGIAAAWAAARFTQRGKRLWSRAIDVIPLVGPVIRAARLSAFTDLLGMLVEFGVPLPTAVSLAGAASSDPFMAARAREVEADLNRGEPFGEAARDGGLVPAWVAWLASAGEKRGELAPALREIAALYRRQVDTRSSVLRSILPPLVVIVVAVFLTFFFVLAIMTPMVKLLEGLSK
jgi:type II secretory pathway component PulF